MSSTFEVAKRDQAVDWLLKNENPGVRYWTLRDILERYQSDADVVSALSGIEYWGPAAEYLREQNPAGYWGDGEDVYWPKWRATVWALMLLAELGVPVSVPVPEPNTWRELLAALDARADSISLKGSRVAVRYFSGVPRQARPPTASAGRAGTATCAVCFQLGNGLRSC